MGYGVQSSIVSVLVLFFLAWLFGLLRCYVRILMLRSFWMEDWLALLSLVLLIGPVACYLTGIYNYNLDRDMSTFHDPVILKKALATVYFPELFYTVGTALIKVSFGLTLLRLLRHRWQRLAATATMVLVVIISIVFFFVFLFYCSPISYAWNRGVDPYFLAFAAGKDPAGLGLKPRGTCKSNAEITNMNYAHGAVMVVADLTLGIILPIMLLRDLNMKRSLKISTCAVLGLGATASIATIVRFPYIHTLSTENNFFKDANPILVWSYLEYCLCIIGAACTTLKPLAKKIRLVGESTGGDSRGKNAGTTSGSSNPLSKVMLKSKGWVEGDVELANSPAGATWTGNGNDSKEAFITSPRPAKAPTGISRTVEVHQTYGHGG